MDPEVDLATLRAIAEQVAELRAENGRLMGRMSAGETRFRQVARGILRTQEAERGRISRELHDGLGQSLTALKMQLEMLAQSAEATGAPLAASLRDVVALADQSLQEVRQAAHLLRPQILDELGLVPTLRWLARAMRQRTGLMAELEVEETEERLPFEIETLVFRFVQEALTNAAKHAGTEKARVFLRAGEGRVRCTVEDEGRGFDGALALRGAEEDRGFGLRGLRDRVQLFGGRLTVDSQPGAGTRLAVDVPLAAETA